MMGLALLKEMHLPVQFALPLIKQLLGIALCMEDLRELDSALYDTIMGLRGLNAEEIEELALDFTVDDVQFGKRRKINLLFGGETMQVTKGNVDVYTSLRIEHHLRKDAHMIAALKRGLHQFCPEALLLAAGACFTTEEFDILLSGSREILVDDWKKHTTYSNCSVQVDVIKWFWKTVKSFSEKERKRLLRFATGQTNAPIGGFQLLKKDGEIVDFSISLKATPKHSDVRSYYPTAATCTNTLQLPRYKQEADLKKYLRLAIAEDNMSFEEHQ